MLEHLKRLGGDSLLFALMNVGTKLIAFLMLPIYTSYLGAEQLGVLENVDAFTSMLTFIVIFGTDSALAFFYFDTKDKLEKEKYVRNVLMFRIMVASVLLLLAIFTGNFISKLIFGVPGYGVIVQIALVVLFLESVITLVLTYFRYEFLSKKVVVYTVSRLGTVAILSYLFLRYMNAEVSVIFYARIIGAISILVLLFPYIKRFFTFKIDFPLLKEILIYAAPLVPASIAFWVISSSNRFFLSQYDSLAHVGVYGVAVKFATVITLLTSSVQMAWRPYSMSIKDRSDAKTVFANIYLLVLIIGMFGLLGIATFIPYILHWMIPKVEFHSASKYIAVLSLGTFLNFYYLIISVGLFITKKTNPISIYFGIAAIISICLNIVLIPNFSLWGATLAVVLSYLFACIAIFIKSQKVYHVPVSIFNLVVVFISGVLSLLSIVYIQEYTNLNGAYTILSWLFYFGMIVIIYLNVKRVGAKK
ncbi:oligosaccharide flippase family protein [Lederbergia citri]|uniref:Oligosaccharide flippase family protein n=1 Tax=Lederbergia citri TaxID=2833580 RepID=A0A942TFT0_9BACI|nr:oligosaccharide flippase family protein [Lederbergia citri]MBS4195732.1 oligosaccharide flippase family protein [Lederbergia citri]